jgi:alkylation response protein AidB-like acyl-CoA dehydrogenase
MGIRLVIRDIFCVYIMLTRCIIIGTAYVTFEDVKVPKENLIGKENKGFKYIMWNFNSERLGIIIQANRFARVCVEESIKVRI